MKTTPPMFIALIALAVPAAAFADPMDSMPGMARPAQVKTGHGVGVIKALDAKVTKTPRAS